MTTKRRNALPDIVHIGPRYYKVSRVKELHKGKRGAAVDGKIDYQAIEISLDASLRGKHQLETLLHEILHGIAYQMGIRISENAVGSLGYALTEMLIDNPEMIIAFAHEAEKKYLRSKRGKA